MQSLKKLNWSEFGLPTAALLEKRSFNSCITSSFIETVSSKERYTKIQLQPHVPIGT